METSHNGEAIPSSILLVPRGSSLGLVVGTYILYGLHLPLGEIPLMAHLVLGETMLLEVPPFLGELTLWEHLISPTT